MILISYLLIGFIVYISVNLLSIAAGNAVGPGPYEVGFVVSAISFLCAIVVICTIVIVDTIKETFKP